MPLGGSRARYRGPTWGDPTKWLRLAMQDRVLVIFVIIDSQSESDSILRLQTVNYPSGRLHITKWMDNFPFPYYVIVKNLATLPVIMGDALRQWFEEVQERT